METIQDRLAMFLTELNISTQKFERQCDMGQGAASKLSPKSYATTFAKISRAYPQLNIDWLKTGKGQMLNQSTESSMGIKDRIKQLIDFERLSVLSFEKSVGLSNGYLRNTASISAENCAKILTTYPDISAEWLMKGEGDMQKPVQTVGDISNSNVAGVNVSGKEIHISNPEAYNALLETVRTYQRITEKYQSQMDELITMLKAKI